jgi:prepilin-type N-terminal cleavage/methylation domain-containing protein
MRTTHHRCEHENGFSLIELVVVVAILTIIMGAAFQLMTNSQVSYDRNQILAEAHQNADFAVTRVSELLRGSGANPERNASINELDFIQNKQNPTDSFDPSIVRIRSDLNGDTDLDDRVTASGSQYFLLASEDVTLKYFQNPTTVGGRNIPGNTICIIDNTTGEGQGVPYILAEHIVSFKCPVTPPIPAEVTVTIEAGPSRAVAPGDPRYITFTRVMQIRLRNRV